MRLSSSTLLYAILSPRFKHYHHRSLIESPFVQQRINFSSLLLPWTTGQIALDAGQAERGAASTLIGGLRRVKSTGRDAINGHAAVAGITTGERKAEEVLRERRRSSARALRIAASMSVVHI